jgi:hypothetical protein
VNHQPHRPARRRFAELDAATTPMGPISLRRRWDPTVEHEVYEIKLDDEYLMSSMFTTAEAELARIGLADLPDMPLDVAVGGLGLGYTAHAALADPRVRSLLVIEALEPVIDWHQRHLVPLGANLTSDPRCRLVAGDASWPSTPLPPPRPSASTSTKACCPPRNGPAPATVTTRPEPWNGWRSSKTPSAPGSPCARSARSSTSAMAANRPANTSASSSHSGEPRSTSASPNSTRPERNCRS